MERRYYVHDRQETVDEIPDVWAVHVKTDPQGQPLKKSRSFGQSAASALRTAKAPDEVIQAFEKENWYFIKPSGKTKEAMSAEQSAADIDEAGKVVKKTDGSILIATNRLSVQLKPEFSEQECQSILEEKQLQKLRKLESAPNLFEVRTHNHSDALDASVELHEDKRFILAEPAFIEQLAQGVIPNDPDIPKQWQWQKTRVQEAWEHGLGAGINVGIIDMGFDGSHEDLSPHSNRYGYGLLSYYEYPREGEPPKEVFYLSYSPGFLSSAQPHSGTFCAGLIGALHNNGKGGSGATPECSMTYYSLYHEDKGTQEALETALGPASNNHIICCLVPVEFTASVKNSLDNLAKSRNGLGSLLFLAADESNLAQNELASHPNVIMVVGSDSNNQKSHGGNGAYVELTAPGKDVYSTTPGSKYGFDSGASYAAACAAGCAALVLSANPELSAKDLRRVLRDTADKVGGVNYDAKGHNDQYGYGRINVLEAIRQAKEIRPVTLIQNRSGAIGNFEIIFNRGGRLFHYSRDNSTAGVPWHKVSQFAENVESAPALIQSNFGNVGNFEVVVREGTSLRHYYLNNDAAGSSWNQGNMFGENITSAPALIQSNFGTKGNFEVVVREGTKLRHYYRDNDTPHAKWQQGVMFGENITSAPAMIQSRLGQKGNFEVVVREGTKLRHYYRDNDAPGTPWQQGNMFGDNVTSAPALIQSNYGTKGNLEVIVREGTKLRHYYRDSDTPHAKWQQGEMFGETISSDPVLIQSSYGEKGNFEIIVRDGYDLRHYWRENDAPGTPWHMSGLIEL
jgi:hypothetical protein